MKRTAEFLLRNDALQIPCAHLLEERHSRRKVGDGGNRFLTSGNSCGEPCELRTSRALGLIVSPCSRQVCERSLSRLPLVQRSNSAGDAATYRPMRVTGIPSFAQHCAVETGWLRNLATAVHPFNDSCDSFSFGIAFRYLRNNAMTPVHIRKKEIAAPMTSSRSLLRKSGSIN